MITVKRKAKFSVGKRRGASGALVAGRIPRVARLMALAIRFDQLIREGVVTDQAELARLGHVSRGRVTQIMDLLTLAPEVQEALLFLPVAIRGRQVVTERSLRTISSSASWRRQRYEWSRLNVSRNSMRATGEQASK